MHRSHSVSHWTGKDIYIRSSDLTDFHRAEYHRRLMDTLENGLWMTRPNEELRGWSPGPRPSTIKYQAPMTCFTELRLSGSHSHNAIYGLLGFVFDRSFVLERAGGPVHYVRSHRDEPVIGNLVQALEWVNDQKRRGTDYAQEVLECLNFNAGFIKAMSRPDSDDFAYLDEHEWRIIHNHLQQKAGRIVQTGLSRPEYRIPFTRGDIRMLVLPDEETRQLVLRDPRARAWLTDNVPPLLTIDEVCNL